MTLLIQLLLLASWVVFIIWLAKRARPEPTNASHGPAPPLPMLVPTFARVTADETATTRNPEAVGASSGPRRAEVVGTSPGALCAFASVRVPKRTTPRLWLS